MYFSKIPSIAKFFYKDITFNIPSREKIVYLTFDDGPTAEITEWVLGVLKKYKAEATFFCIGKNIEKNPGAFRKIIADGHSIGNHTYEHLNGWKTPVDEYIENVKKCDEVIHGCPPPTAHCLLPLKLFRPPYGKILKSQISHLTSQYSIIMWDVLSGDFDRKISGENCLKNVIKNAGKGSVVVFHDSEKASGNLYYSLPKAMEFFGDKGFRFEKLI